LQGKGKKEDIPLTGHTFFSILSYMSYQNISAQLSDEEWKLSFFFTSQPVFYKIEAWKKEGLKPVKRVYVLK
jgi:hypothetical protein